MQPIEVSPAVLVSADDLRIDNGRNFDPCRLLGDARVTIRPVGSPITLHS
jgi:hypothetical protein